MQDAPDWSLFYFVRGWAAKNLASNLNSITGTWKNADGNLAIARKICYFFLQSRQAVTDRSTEEKALRRIHSNGEGWAFSARDFADLGSRPTIDSALHRLERKGSIRRIIRGVYDRPQFSAALSTELSPDLDQVARALARKFGWRIQPSGAVAQNLLRLSTQVAARAVYLSDGPNRSYQVGRSALVFDHTALKEAGFRLPESGLIVQALKSLGQEHVTPDAISKIRAWLPASLRARVLADTATATGWVYAALRQIAGKDTDGSSRKSAR